MILNKKQNTAIETISHGRHCFISGPGGVGKSVAARKVIELFGNSTVVLAPTGIAALNIGGATIHSAFKLPFHVLTNKDSYNVHKKTEALFSTNSPVKRIMIDEISMVRTDILYTMDRILRKVRRKNVPFGGLQIIVIGDFFQLPPVVTNNDKKVFYDNYDSPYCFSGDLWAETNFEYIELDEVMRQDDQEMIGHLLNIRNKADGYVQSVEFFNKHGKRNLESVLDTDPVFLCTTNSAAGAINHQNYSEIEEKEHKFYADKSHGFKGRTPVEEELCLKYGCKVILCANTEDYKNGQIGYVTGFVGDRIEVLIEETEQTVFVERYNWEQIEYNVTGGKLGTEVVGTFKQYPMKLAWAITIHKAQGQTIPNAVVNMGNGAFCHGQTYVALSRVKSVPGFGLMGSIDYSDVIVDEVVKEFYENGCRGNSLF